MAEDDSEEITRIRRLLLLRAELDEIILEHINACRSSHHVLIPPDDKLVACLRAMMPTK